MTVRTALATLAGLLLAALALAAEGQEPEASLQDLEPVSVDAESLIRRVVKSQRVAEFLFRDYAYDLREVRTTYARSGRPKEVTRRLFNVFSPDVHEGEATRELVEVDGRPPTEKERRDFAEEEAQGRERRMERQAAARASRPPSVSGGEDDPLVGPRRLSDLMSRFDYEVAGLATLPDGRQAYVLDFRPRPGAPASSLNERALNSLAGRALIDATDFQLRQVTARLTRPVKVAGGLAANIQEAVIRFEAADVARGRWFPCRVDLRLSGKAALFFRVDTGYRYEFSGFSTFAVEMDARVETEASVESAR